MSTLLYILEVPALIFIMQLRYSIFLSIWNTVFMSVVIYPMLIMIICGCWHFPNLVGFLICVMTVCVLMLCTCVSLSPSLLHLICVPLPPLKVKGIFFSCLYPVVLTFQLNPADFVHPDTVDDPNPFIYPPDLLAMWLKSLTSQLICSFLLFHDIFPNLLAHRRLQIDACNAETYRSNCTAAGMTQQQQGWGQPKSHFRDACWGIWHSQQWFVELRGFYVSVLLHLTRAAFMTAKDAKPCRVFSKIFTLHELIKCLLHIRRDEKKPQHLPECDMLY